MFNSTIIFVSSIHLSMLLQLANSNALPATEPPFHGTIFVNKSIVLDDDPSEYDKVIATGIGVRRMFDRRSNRFDQVEARLYRADFKDGTAIEVQVNPEFDDVEAKRMIDLYLPVVGQLPAVLRKDVKTIWIHKGKKPFGGGNYNLLIHTEMGEEYVRDGILAETLCHEAAHTSLDATHANNERWLNAQRLDDGFISKYARDNPLREDVAESFLLYIALRYRPDRISKELIEKIGKTIPNRIKYFDSLELDMRPIVQSKTAQ